MIGMLKKEKAQVSIELILITGAFIVMALTMMPLIFSNFELSKAIAAARDGAEFAVAMKGMGYTRNESIIIPPGAIKIKNITLEQTNGPPSSCNITGKTWYRIKFYTYVPSYIYDNAQWRNSIEGTIGSYARGNLYRAFYGNYAPDTEGVPTDRYCFTIGYNLMPY